MLPVTHHRVKQLLGDAPIAIASIGAITILRRIPKTLILQAKPLAVPYSLFPIPCSLFPERSAVVYQFWVEIIGIS
ncbi:MAG: hypothetical protein F6K44_22185 [Moorea sp. SIO3E2]|nr:hypothetical protein [Moorena sp. SIO3E2]